MSRACACLRVRMRVCVCARAGTRELVSPNSDLPARRQRGCVASLAWPCRGTHADVYAQVVNGWGQYELQALWKEMVDMGSGKCPAVHTLSSPTATTPHAVPGG